MKTSTMPLQARLDDGTTATAQLSHELGRHAPRHWYHVGQVVHAAAELQLFKPQRTLLLGNNLTGASELHEPQAHSAAALRLLVQQAQQHVQTLGAGARLIVELRGEHDAAGASPFWHGLGRHFCPVTPQQAMHAFGPNWQAAVAPLLPRQLVYASFLDAAAQRAIGACDEAGLALREALIAAGFAWHGHVGIADGGAVLEWVAPAATART